MKPLKLIVCVLFTGICALFASCSKNDSQDSFSIESYNSNSDLNIAIYASQADYKNSTNPVVSGILKANSMFTFPTSKLRPGTWYWVDAYSNDYSLTNWGSGDGYAIGTDSNTLTRFKYMASNKTFTLSTIQTNARKMLLKNNQPYTKWKAIDALDLTLPDQSIWYTLAPYQRYDEIYIYKDHTGINKSLSGTDTVITSFSFTNDIIVGYPVFIILPDQTQLNMFIQNTSVNSSASSYIPPTLDTFAALVNGNLYVLIGE